MANLGWTYTSTARFDGEQRPLGEDELRRVAPSIFATEAHESRSERFKAIPTWEILKGLAQEGFFPVAVKQCSVRDESKREYTKHMLRLRRLDGRKYQVGDNVVEQILKNANDGTSVYDLMAGVFRIRCMNSLVAQTATIDTVKVRHSGDVMGKVIEGTYRVLQESEKLLAAPADWGSIDLNREEREVLAESARTLRWGDAEGNVTTPIRAEQLLIPRRAGDLNRDLWTTFNVIQENAMKGGLSAYSHQNGHRRRTTSREVRGIDQDVKLNKALWQLAEGMAQLKRAA